MYHNLFTNQSIAHTIFIKTLFHIYICTLYVIHICVVFTDAFYSQQLGVHKCLIGHYTRTLRMFKCLAYTKTFKYIISLNYKSFAYTTEICFHSSVSIPKCTVCTNVFNTLVLSAQLPSSYKWCAYTELYVKKPFMD